MRKRNLYVIAFAIILCGLLDTAALAAVKSKHVTFNQDLVVGGTVVKKGDYKVTFDDQSRQLLISSGKRVVARAAASLEEPGAREHYVYTTRQGEGGQPDALMSVNMGRGLGVISLDRPEGDDAQPMPAQQ